MKTSHLRSGSAAGRIPGLRQQRGASLVVSLLMLVAVLLLGISTAQIALMGEKSSHNDRDRQIAFQAAEAALMDAEMDIEKSPDSTKSRSDLFSENPVLSDFAAGCGAGASNNKLGLCATANPGTEPIWKLVDFTDTGSTTTKTVPFGRFTGQILQTGKGSLSSKPPRYIIEAINYRAAGEDASVQSTYFYRITAMGFGARETTQAVLQSFYRKIDQ